MLRIISQDRCVDVPYEKAAIYTEQDDLPSIWATLGGPDGEDLLLGYYDSEDRCIEIMQELRECQFFYYLMPEK